MRGTNGSSAELADVERGRDVPVVARDEREEARQRRRELCVERVRPHRVHAPAARARPERDAVVRDPDEQIVERERVQALRVAR